MKRLNGQKRITISISIAYTPKNQHSTYLPILKPAILKIIRHFIILASMLSFAGCGQPPKDAITQADTAAKTDPAGKTIPIQQDSVPPRLGWISDYASLFSEVERSRLDSLVSNYEKKTTIEIAVVTLDSAQVSGKDFDAYTLVIANAWGVGKEDVKNGVLIGIAPSLRRMRIQNGYGIEKILSNEQTKAIIDTIFTPRFREGKFFEGTKQGILAIMNKLTPTN